jgi:hypothetical protein
MQGILTGNFFSNWELFYLTHIHHNWAGNLTSYKFYMACLRLQSSMSMDTSNANEGEI